jgi:WD repeat-containing protein 61
MATKVSFMKPAKKVEAAHGDCIWSLAYAKGNALTGSLDGTVKYWDRDLNLIGTSGRGKVGINSVTALRDNSTAIACFQDSIIRFYSLPDMKEMSFIDPGLLDAWTVCLSPTDEVLVSGTQRGTVNVWSMQEGHEKVASLETRNNKFILSTVFSRDLKLATAGIDGFVNIFDIKTQQIVQKIEAHALPIRSVAFSPDRSLLYTASDDRHVSVYDTVSGSLINSFSQSGMALSVDASPDHRHFVVGCADHNVTLWDLGMQRFVQNYDNHSDQVWCVKFDGSDASGSRFASVGDDALLQTYA